MATYSHSKLCTFENCEYKFKLRYIEGIKPEFKATIEAFMGCRVHETLEKLYKDLKFMKENSLEELLKFLDIQWEKEWADNIIIAKKEYSKENYKKMAEKFITDYYNRYKPFNEFTIIGLETENKLKLSNGSSYHIRIDKLGCKNNVYYVCDYKTNSSLKTQEEADKDRQLAMYALWVSKKFKDAKKVILKWHMLAFDKDVISERTSKELKKLEQESIKLINKIESTKEFKPNKTSLCNWCEYHYLCSEFKHEKETEQLPQNKYLKEEGVVLANKFIELKAKEKEIETELTELKNAITYYAKEKGYTALMGSDGKITIHETTTTRLPKKDSKEYLQLEKLIKKINKWNELSSLDQTKIKRFLEEKPNKKIEELLEETETTTIRAGKK